MSREYIFFTGRNKELSALELDSLYGFGNFDHQNDFSLISLTDKPTINNLGGVIKISEILIKISANSNIPLAIESFFEDIHIDHKFNIALSNYTNRIQNINKLKNLLFDLKKKLKAKHKVRIIEPRGLVTSTAQIIYNQLTDDDNFELNLTELNDQICISKTIAVQDINSFSFRDFNKPIRDAKNGMLPPKLALMMVNMRNYQRNRVIADDYNDVLDPFCGSGVVLMEAALQGLHVKGSDINPEMIVQSSTNLKWLADHYKIETNLVTDLKTQDAVIGRWKGIEDVVAETYLGKPLHRSYSPEEAINTSVVASDFHIKFLQNLLPQLRQDSRVVLAIPAWIASDRKIYIQSKLIDYLPKIGYNILNYDHHGPTRYCYYRDGQFVARQILILKTSN